MNGQLYFQFYKDAAFRDAAGRVLENVLTQFEELSEGDLEKRLNTNVEFLVNDHMRNITNTTVPKDIDSFNYTIGRGKFDATLLSKVCSEMEGKWVISVDESIIDKESFVGEVAYRHSCAFGYKIPQPQQQSEEKILAVSSILRLEGEADFDRKMQFLPYLLNLYVAFYTAKILQHFNEPIFAVILHGPLIRQLAPFLNLRFRKEIIKKVVTADTDPPDGISQEVKNIAQGKLLDSIIADPTYKDSLEPFIGSALSPDIKKQVNDGINKRGEIPGICFYFSLLRRLSDLAKAMDFHLIGCVESARSTEYSKLYVQYQVEKFGQNDVGRKILRKLFHAYGVSFSKQHVRKRFRELIDKSGWDDEMIQSFSLKFDDDQLIKSEFTYPVPIRRYIPGDKNENIFGFKFGSTFIFEPPGRETLINQIIDGLYPFSDYRMLMSFVRTSDFRAPIRVEFLEQGNEEKWKELLAATYIASLPYTSYGLPVFLYYADKMARMPKEIISTVTESYLFEQATRALNQLGLSGISLKDVLLAVTQKFRRDFYERG